MNYQGTLVDEVSKKNALELYDWHQGRQCRMPT